MSRLTTNYPSGKLGRPVDYERIKRAGYHNDGIFVVCLDDGRLNAFERQFLKNIGAKLYGHEMTSCLNTPNPS